jgi:hypothetical protein
MINAAVYPQPPQTPTFDVEQPVQVVKLSIL